MVSVIVKWTNPKETMCLNRHPDKNIEAEAIDKFIDINKAYEVSQ